MNFSARSNSSSTARTALEYFGWRGVRVVGHSMGAFVGVRLAAERPELVGELTLIDGGIPLPTDDDNRPQDVLGPAIERLTMRFPTPDAYREFWGQHPAFGPYWNDQIERYIRYDLFPVDGGFQPTANPEAVATNLGELDGSGGHTEALESLRMPYTLFTSPRGLFDEEPGLYPPSWLAQWSKRLPTMAVRHIPDTNHYTVLLSEAVMTVVDKLKEES